MVELGRGEDGSETCGEKGTTTVPSLTFAADETPFPHVRPFLPLFSRFQQHSVVLVPQSRGKVIVVVPVVCVEALHRMSEVVEMAPVLCWMV
jgi:hypothetical protein